MIPTWIPAGYVLERAEADKTPVRRNYTALYVKGEQNYSICLRLYVASNPQKVEGNENIIETITADMNEYYIISNNRILKAIWIQNSFKCIISGDFTVDEIKQMIKSISEGQMIFMDK